MSAEFPPSSPYVPPLSVQETNKALKGKEGSYRPLKSILKKNDSSEQINDVAAKAWGDRSNPTNKEIKATLAEIDSGKYTGIRKQLLKLNSEGSLAAANEMRAMPTEEEVVEDQKINREIEEGVRVPRESKVKIPEKIIYLIPSDHEKLNKKTVVFSHFLDLVKERKSVNPERLDIELRKKKIQQRMDNPSVRSILKKTNYDKRMNEIADVVLKNDYSYIEIDTLKNELRAVPTREECIFDAIFRRINQREDLKITGEKKLTRHVIFVEPEKGLTKQREGGFRYGTLGEGAVEKPEGFRHTERQPHTHPTHTPAKAEKLSFKGRRKAIEKRIDDKILHKQIELLKQLELQRRIDAYVQNIMLNNQIENEDDYEDEKVGQHSY